jgi:hypothetical protein
MPSRSPQGSIPLSRQSTQVAGAMRAVHAECQKADAECQNSGPLGAGTYPPKPEQPHRNTGMVARQADSLMGLFGNPAFPRTTRKKQGVRTGMVDGD